MSFYVIIMGILWTAIIIMQVMTFRNYDKVIENNRKVADLWKQVREMRQASVDTHEVRSKEEP